MSAPNPPGFGSRTSLALCDELLKRFDEAAADGKRSVHRDPAFYSGIVEGFERAAAIVRDYRAGAEDSLWGGAS